MTINRKPKYIAYCRVSTDDQTAENQRHTITEYAQNHRFFIDEWVMVEMSSRRTLKERRIEELKEKLKTGDTLIATEMSRIGRSLIEVLGIIDWMRQEDIGFIFLKENIVKVSGKPMDTQTKALITIFGLLTELERDLISMRTRESLQRIRASGVKLGKPRGLVQHSKLDPHVDKIKELLKARISVAGVARALDSSRHNLTRYLTVHPELLREVKEYLKHKKTKGERK